MASADYDAAQGHALEASLAIAVVAWTGLLRVPGHCHEEPHWQRPPCARFHFEGCISLIESEREGGGDVTLGF